MKRYIFAGVSMALVLAACSKNEVFEVNQDGNEIQYSVVANNATKAADIYCNNNKPAEFTVFAESSDGKTYINGDKITKKETDGNNTWVNESGTRFWPNDLSLDFYAIVNGTIEWNVFAEGNAPATIVNYEVSTDVAKQQDLLYAVKTDQEKGATETEPVTLNFRHALSQVVFQAKNTNENLYVEISGVKIVNVANMNTFTFPTSNTDNTMLVDTDHDGSFEIMDEDYKKANRGTWAPLDPESGAAGSTVYPVTFDDVVLDGKTTIVNLTNNVYTSADAGDEVNANALLLLPQNAKAWNPAEVTSPVVTGQAADGSYFLVNCAIYNIAGESFAATDTPLWGTTAEHKEVAVPVEINWEQGKKYVYTFVFGEGGGFDPVDPDPVLVPVTFKVSVDDFVSVANSDIDMDVK